MELNYATVILSSYVYHPYTSNKRGESNIKKLSLQGSTNMTEFATEYSVTVCRRYGTGVLQWHA